MAQRQSISVYLYTTRIPSREGRGAVGCFTLRALNSAYCHVGRLRLDGRTRVFLRNSSNSWKYIGLSDDLGGFRGTCVSMMDEGDEWRNPVPDKRRAPKRQRLERHKNQSKR